ncbi:MAG: response regulator [Dehalococcoidia bacterium]|nr:response regulator [Dehalococcoidia bacterium]
MEKKTHILVVDDEQSILQMLRKTLELEGFAITVAVNGNSALALLAEQAPDLVLLDIRMPGLNGYQVLERIRESSNVPVIMLTAVREQTAAERSLGLGADDYITKPFITPVLIARIRAKLRRARGELRHTDDQIANMDSPS